MANETVNKHRVPTPEDIKREWLDVSEVYAVSKTLYENGEEPNQRYADRMKQAKRESDFWLDLYIDLGYLAVEGGGDEVENTGL